MKRFFLMVLSALFILSSFSACSQKENPSLQESEGELIPVSEPKQEEINFYGAKFIMGSVDLHEFLYDEGVTGPGDRMLQRYKDVREKFNLELEFHDMETSNDAAAEVVTLLSAMKDIPDFYDMMSIDVYTLFKKDVLADYKTLTNLDITSEKWGTSDFLQQVAFQDGIYGVWCNDWENPVPQMGCTMLINNTLYSSLGQSDPYELLETGKWTWENFRQIAADCTVEEDKTKINGIDTINMQILLNEAIYSNGVEKIINQNGKWIFGYNDPKAEKAIDFCVTLKNDGSLPKAAGGGEAFGNGKCVFFTGDSWVGTADDKSTDWLPLFTLDNFGWVPFPYGPDGTYGSWNAISYYNQRFFAMIPTENEAEDIALVMDAIFEPLDDTEPKAWKTYARANMFFSDESFDIFVNELENIKCDHSSILGIDMINDIGTALQKVFLEKATYAEAIQSIEPKVNDLLEIEMNK